MGAAGPQRRVGPVRELHLAGLVGIVVVVAGVACFCCCCCCCCCCRYRRDFVFLSARRALAPPPSAARPIQPPDAIFRFRRRRRRRRRCCHRRCRYCCCCPPARSLARSHSKAFFGFQPPLPFAYDNATAAVPVADAVLRRPDLPRGFNGTLHGVAWGGRLWDVTSDAETGLGLLASSSY